MEFRNVLDAETGQPYIDDHGVTEAEVEQVVHGSGEDLPEARGSRMELGQTSAGRYLQVISVPDEEGEGFFVIIAYDPQGKAKRAFRRRQRKGPR